MTEPSRLLHSDAANRALLFAQFAHFGQVRKTGGPYYKHPQRVAVEVAYSRKATQAMVLAAYLHDVLEDTRVTEDEISLHFGIEVLELVRALTDVYTPEGCPGKNREWRKRQEAERLRRVPWEARLIKRADMKDNLRDIDKFNPGFAKVFREEKHYLEFQLDLGDADDGVDTHL